MSQLEIHDFARALVTLKHLMRGQVPCSSEIRGWLGSRYKTGAASARASQEEADEQASKLTIGVGVLASRHKCHAAHMQRPLTARIACFIILSYASSL